MADKRMFSQKIIDSDLFLDMPQSTQNLYFHLCMRADDDGFINNPKRIQKVTSATEDDLKLLIAKQFIIPFASGVVVIKHWKIHNYIRADRYKETINIEEKSMLSEGENREYILGIPNDIPVVDTDKNRLDKNRLDKINIYCEVISYLNQKAGTHFRDNIDSTRRLIDARLNQGFEVNDFMKVIDIKCNTWLKNKDMKKYLRPETLFGTKFEGYLNEATALPKAKTNLDTWMEDANDKTRV